MPRRYEIGRLEAVGPAFFEHRMRIACETTRLGVVVCLAILATGCATIRTTDPPHTATEQFLLTGAAQAAVEQLSADALRDRIVFIDTTYLTTAWQTAPELSFMIGEFRARLLKGGARLAPTRDKAQIVLEVRSNGVGIDRLEFLL
jgi:hypothetical protein